MTSNSPETLQLLADQLQSMLTQTLGPDHIYVLITRSGPPENLLCNLISNAPLDNASQLQEVFAELSQRQVLTSN